ncbi:hypothetical protein D3C73_1525680 [compost metagenome]
MFLGPLVASSGSIEGTNTRTILELHRTALTEDRQHALERHLLVYSEVSRNDLPVVVRKAIYEDFVAREAAAGAEYSAMNRALIAAMESRLPPDILT